MLKNTKKIGLVSWGKCGMVGSHILALLLIFILLVILVKMRLTKSLILQIKFNY